jgi:energy-coupling factor transport system ATP-binding protein
MLDPANRRQVLDTIRRLNAEGLTIILVTQAMDEAIAARRVLVMHGGRVVMDGSPMQIFEHDNQLREWGLDLPTAVEITHRLKKQGWQLPQGLLTVEQLARALC